MVKFSHVIFYIKDMNRTISFYQKAFGIGLRFLDESGVYAELETGDVKLAFVLENIANSNLPSGYYKNDPAKLPAGCEIVFTTDDVQSTFNNALKVGAIKVTDPEKKPWGQTIAYVLDPEGVLIEIGSKMP